MSEQNKVAFIRGLYNAIGTFGASFVSALLVDANMNQAALVAAVAAFAVLGFRGGVEGAYDTHRDRNDQRIPGDVTGALE